MALRFRGTHIMKAAQAVRGRVSQKSGNILVYIVMIMVIFGLLGALMVSLFSTSISSSATRNDTRRAAYLSEAGIRYAMSELRAADFSKTAITNLNKNFKNDDYKMSPTETFGLNIFSPWFEPTSAIDIGAGGNGTEVVQLPEGQLPSGFTSAIPTVSPLLTIVNSDYIDLLNPTKPNPPPSARGAITGAADVALNPRRLQIEISDDGNSNGFVASKNETLCFAVSPNSDQAVSLPGSLLLEPVAAKLFPAVGGAFEINRHNYYYAQAIDRTTHVELTGVTAFADEKSPWKDTINALTTDYVILSPRNRFIVSEGTSGTVTFGNSMDYAIGVADTSVVGPKSRKPDIDFEEENLESVLGQVETSNNTSLFTVDNDPGDKLITIGAGPGPSFGALWFRDTRSIGGQREFCGVGECQFGIGIRVFFTFTATNDSGEGFIFSLTNGQENSIGSVGGDIQRSELLGYSGDSRIDNPVPPTSPIFLDGAGKGLQPPKIGFEFDTRVNYSSTFEQNQSNYCSGNDLKENTRNDPLSSDKHAVQYVFWAKENLSPPCRNTDGGETYDDNRHDAAGEALSNWAKNLSGNTNSDPLIRSSDGTIYIGSAANRLFAVKPDGTEKWTFGTPTGEVYSPVLAHGRIYVGSADGKVYAIDPSNGNLIKASNTLDGPVTTRPAVDKDGFVYVTSGKFLYKIDFSNSPPSSITFNPDPVPTKTITSSPAISQDGNTVYAGFSDNKLYARKTSDLTLKVGWNAIDFGQKVIGIPAVASNGYIYISTSNKVRKISPNTGFSESSTFISNPTSSPTLSKDGNTVYAGFSDGKLYAYYSSDLSASSKWSFSTGGTSVVATPEVDDNENIYVGSDNNFVYALYADGSEKWRLDTGGAVSAKPAVDQNGTVYVGSNSSGGRLLAINQFPEPRNYRQNFENPPKPELAQNLVAYSDPKAVNPYLTKGISNTNKWFKDGPWAVRIEVDRLPSTGDRTEYTLRTWVQQCTDNNCTNVRGTFFEDTRIKYNPAAKPPNLVQSFELDSILNPKFNTFLFGFTSAKKENDDQLITIDNFQLSFIRPGDPEIIVE
jgi:outer membrane protein assembly factor BamB